MPIGRRNPGRPGVLAWDGDRFHYCPAFEVKPVDTTGAGDIFHAAFAFALLRGDELPRSLEFSCAAAGLACMGMGARGGIASIEKIEELIRNGQRGPDGIHAGNASGFQEGPNDPASRGHPADARRDRQRAADRAECSGIPSRTDAAPEGRAARSFTRLDWFRRTSSFSSPGTESASARPSFRMFTSMFLHGGWMHLLGNMLFLWVFGGAVEEALGHFQYLIFYLICGVGSALVHTMFNLGSKVPTIGASGAISGVMGAFIVLFPRARVTTLIPGSAFIFHRTDSRVSDAGLLVLPAVLQRRGFAGDGRSGRRGVVGACRRVRVGSVAGVRRTHQSAERRVRVEVKQGLSVNRGPLSGQSELSMRSTRGDKANTRAHRERESCLAGDRYFGLNDIFDPVAAAGGDVPGQREIFQRGKRDVVRPADAGLEHAAAPDRNLPRLAEVVNPCVRAYTRRRGRA